MYTEPIASLNYLFLVEKIRWDKISSLKIKKQSDKDDNWQSHPKKRIAIKFWIYSDWIVGKQINEMASSLVKVFVVILFEYPKKFSHQSRSKKEVATLKIVYVSIFWTVFIFARFNHGRDAFISIFFYIEWMPKMIKGRIFTKNWRILLHDYRSRLLRRALAVTYFYTFFCYVHRFNQ